MSYPAQTQQVTYGQQAVQGYPPQPGGQFITKEDLSGQHIQNATIQECDVVNCTLTNCNITKADFKGTCTLQNCTTREIDVYGTVTVQGGSFTWGEVKAGGQVIDQGAHIEDIDGYIPQSGYGGGPPPGAMAGGMAGGAMAGGAMAGGAYGAQGNYPPPPPQGAYGQQHGHPLVPGQGAMGANDAWGVVARSQKMIVEQQISMLEVLADTANTCEACCEQPNVYKIYDEAGRHVMTAKEESEFCNRCCCNPCHELILHVTDEANGQEVLRVDRPMKCGGCCPAWCGPCQHEATATSNGRFIGKSRQPACGGGCRPEIRVGLNESPDEDYFASVHGPGCCFGGCTEVCCEQEFLVESASGNEADGRINKVMGGLKEIATDSDTFHLEFNNPALDANKKMTLLSTLLLVDYMFFEQNQPFECNPCASPGETCLSCTLFEFYCCGFLLPCKLSCTSASSEDS